MAYLKLNSLRLKKEYCNKPRDELCPARYCYNEEYQCRYWKQIFSNPTQEGYTIRQGNNWYKAKDGNYDNK